MKLATGHLTYCTNVHAGDNLSEVMSSLSTHVTAVKARVSPGEPFGVGLRLSALAAAELEAPGKLAELQAFLQAQGLYVFTLNGFPYGRFHGEPVKRAVYQPDWRTTERSLYTERLARILARLLPEGMVGSISSVPGGFRSDLRERTERERLARRLLDQVAVLHRLRIRTGKDIVLALEPEPGCLLETSEETVAFFQEHLLCRDALRGLSAQLLCSEARVEPIVRRHLGVCVDACHAAIEFEQPDETLQRLEAAGLTIGKIQLSAGLALQPSPQALSALAEYDEPVYLHQVVARQSDGSLLRFVDLPQALASVEARAADEWRVHFHVPLYRPDLGAFGNTQPYLAALLERQRERPRSSHLEVETYTWDVLPASQRTGDVVSSIARELDWVQRRLGGARAAGGA